MPAKSRLFALLLSSCLLALQPCEAPLPSQAQQEIPESELDKRLVKIVARTPLTDEAYAMVLRGLAFLPPDVKRGFVNGGITVTLTPSLAAAGVGGNASEYSPKFHTVFICERNADGQQTDFRRLNITTLHELGHAFDHLLGYPSRTAEFHAIYNREAPTVPSQYYPRLSYFLQPGQAGPRECFASLFACRYYRGDDKRLTQLKECFPQTFQYVEQLRFK